MTLACEVAPSTLIGANVAFFVCGTEVPIEKADFKMSAKKTEVTSTASVVNGVVWEEFSPGSSGGSVSWDCSWRVGQVVAPPTVRPGAIYPVQAYPIRTGSPYACNVFIDSSDITLDPR